VLNTTCCSGALERLLEKIINNTDMKVMITFESGGNGPPEKENTTAVFAAVVRFIYKTFRSLVA